MTGVYIGNEFTELKGKQVLFQEDLNEEGFFIMKVGSDWINSIPQEDIKEVNNKTAPAPDNR